MSYVPHGNGAVISDVVLAGVPRLLDDMQKLLDTRDHADIIFLVGREEKPHYAHRLILNARCKTAAFLKRPHVTTPSTQTVRLPNHRSDNFAHVLTYLYTGKVLVDDRNVFEMWGLSQELGLEELKSFCEEHISRSLNVNNACTLLVAALSNEEQSVPMKKSIDLSNSSFVERCIHFIGENAIECVQSASFLRLTKDALIRLLSSDHLALEEVEVWRAVLNWARHQANVTQVNTQLWSEEERRRVCHALTGVINHVRLLLIDSQVFAEEVEPTGAVPMEVSLERYRLAALPPKANSEDKRLQPRVQGKSFPHSQILNRDRSPLQRVLNQWYSSAPNANIQWRLVFRASQHNFSATEFHRLCDNLAPLYIIIMGSQGEVCGGYTDVPWTMINPGTAHSQANKGRYLTSDKAFLFSLVDSQGQVNPRKFNVVKRTFAICYHAECGPIFGAGADLFISDQCNINMDSYSNLPHSYDGEDADPETLMGDYYFSVLEYEVYTLAK